jgi:heme-degrading monooxygenase HmoA
MGCSPKFAREGIKEIRQHLAYGLCRAPTSILTDLIASGVEIQSIFPELPDTEKAKFTTVVPTGRTMSGTQEESSARGPWDRRFAMFARLVTIEGHSEQLDDFIRVGAEKVLPQLRRLDGFEGSLVLADRRSGKIVTVTLWESEEAMRVGEEVSYWFRAFSAEAAGGEVNEVERYEVVSSEPWRAYL